MESTLRVLNRLEEEGLFRRYAIGGAIGALFYMAPFETEDLDVFILLGTIAHPLTPLAPIYEELKKRGYREDGPYIVVEGLPVQFLPAWNPLIEESVEHARAIQYGAVQTRVPSPEHLAAIMVQTGRAKDRMRLSLLREQAELDENTLVSILDRHGLKDKYAQWTK